MLFRKLLVLLLLVATLTVHSQKNFTYSPEHPKPGDVITFTYQPAGDIANTILPVEAVAYLWGERGYKAEDIKLTKVADKFTGSIQTDASRNFVNFGFSAKDKFDNNFNEGYYILLEDNDKPARYSNYNLAIFYSFGGMRVGVERNNEKAVAAYEKEYSLYPDTKKNTFIQYLRVKTQLAKDNAPALIQKEIEAYVKAGLKDEMDYTNLEALYQLAKSPEQGKFVRALMKEKYPNGKWEVGELVNKFYSEQDLEKKKEILNTMIGKIESGNENWKDMKKSIPGYKLDLAAGYIKSKNWDAVKKAVAESGANKSEIASLYNNVAWEMQEKGGDLKTAEEFSRFATTYAQNEWKNPTETKPESLTAKQWEKNREGMYGMYADTYGMVLYRMGDYKKGYTYAKDATILITKGKQADYNNTYALLAEKALPAKQAKKELEQFVIDGKSTSEITGILKRIYAKEKKSEAGFDNYIAVLQKESYTKMLEELRKSMLNEASPAFALLDLDGKKVNIADLKGKVVVVDFWATWCGPCKASFPGMQKMVNRYKDNQDVKFIFIDTWERGEGKEKNASDFITSNKYSFHVLMDNDDKVVAQFKLDGIPTKFVIDKTGNIRFKSVGFDGSDDKLITELSAMIDLAAGGSPTAPKAF